ncbi:hypothetical protein PT974_05827 [Cladobotryum mycophilum]|uniref:Inner kinetochore subunit AME1 domain-containing protein n=1 Tax=Cladobotryum mycophilum TaxID=491253 RepID=A0ABR0SJV0_9HYPO
MATGREGRAERLNERLRGAQRANVDESFSIDLGGLDIPGSTSPAADEAPSSSSRGQKRDSDTISAASQISGSSARRRSARLAPKDPYDLPDTSKESALQNATVSITGNQDATPNDISVIRDIALSTIARSAVSQQLDPVPDELETLPAPSFVLSSGQVTSPAQARMSSALIEEVGESPANAPGSGKRRRVPLGEAVSSSTKLLDIMTSDDAFPASSSPLARRMQRSDATSMRRSAGMVSKLDLSQEIDELSPERPYKQPLADEELSDAPSMNETTQQIVLDTEADISAPEREDAEPGQKTDVEPGPEPEDQQEEVEEDAADDHGEPEDAQGEEQEEGEEVADEQEEAEEVNAAEAAKVLGKKRRRTQREISPELGSVSAEEEVEREDEQPVPKRKRIRPGKSPATQKQLAVKKKPNKAKPRAKPQAPEESLDEQEPRPKQSKAGRRKSGQNEGNDATIEITVQRFIQHKRRGEDDEVDPLHSEIPFANRGGESVADVFAQVCDEVIASTLAQLREMVNSAADTAKKKECRIKIRAVEAYREELNSRLLQHTIHLNHWHSLRKRVRHVQREKIALREDIIRIRSEREQVALRMDAVRIKHEADTKESKYCLDASTLMHDVDLAMEQGRDAAEPTGKEQKAAELANLELFVSRISEQASSASFTGGILKQVKDFNAFLERAAIALETR